MRPEALATEIEATVKLAQQRIIGVGQTQYYDATTETQRFESMPIDELLASAEEEMLDHINYAVMSRIRFARLRAAIAGALA